MNHTKLCTTIIQYKKAKAMDNKANGKAATRKDGGAALSGGGGALKGDGDVEIPGVVGLSELGGGVVALGGGVVVEEGVGAELEGGVAELAPVTLMASF